MISRRRSPPNSNAAPRDSLLPSVIPFTPALIGAALTTGGLFGGLMLGLVLGNAVFAVMPGHQTDPLKIALSASPAIAGLLLGSALWGRWMGRLAGSVEHQRMAWAGVLGFVPVTIVLALVLLSLESVVMAFGGRGIPIHRQFTFLFVPTAFAIVASASLGLGLGLRNRTRGVQIAWRSGLAAALAFLTLNLVMEALGWVVGAPGAAERYTMVTVLLVGNLGAALAAGAIIGSLLGRQACLPTA